MNPKVRKAQFDDIKWVNEMYDKVQFPHSNFESEFIAIAEIAQQKIGVGRIINVNNKSAEMGGMYVFEAFRSFGISTKIIEFLLENNKNYENIFCLPFEKLKDYYGKFGFELLHENDYIKVPDKILKKYQWCNETFEEKVLLLKLNDIKYFNIN